jgi:haloalkane dehalogenase
MRVMDERIRFGVLLPTGKAQWGEGADPRGLVDFAVRAELTGTTTTAPSAPGRAVVATQQSKPLTRWKNGDSAMNVRKLRDDKMRVEFTPSPELYPFQSHWFETDGVRVHYIDEGAGRPILMCHGNPTWSFLYRKIILRLRGQFRCVAVDYPGFGLSDRPQGYGYTPAEHAAIVGRLVDHLGLDDFIVMGQDWGGPIGMTVASQRAERVGGLVFMNTWFWRTDRLGMRLFSRVMSSRPLQRQVLERNFFVERLMPRLVSHPLEAEVMEHYRRAQPTPEARWGVAEFPHQILASGAWLERLASRASQALRDKPVLLVWGIKDRAFGSRKLIERWQRSFPTAEVIVLADANHFVQEDAPDQIADAVAKKFGRPVRLAARPAGDGV